MKALNGIELQYKGEPRNNYMSLSDLAQDLTTSCLCSIVPILEKLDDQLIVMREIEQREELEDEKYFELLETCNGI